MIPKRTRPREIPLFSPCCRKKASLYGGALVNPTAEHLAATQASEPVPAYMTGGIHWCSQCGLASNLKELVP